MGKPIIKLDLPESSQVGMSRPGAAQIVIGAILFAMSSALTISFKLGGGLFGRLLSACVLLAIWIWYFLGFRKYAASKGYKGFWLTFWLILGNGPGLIVLLLLPDLTVIKNEISIESSGSAGSS